MKKALIIGGSGGLSGRLATLAQENYEVWALTRGKRILPSTSLTEGIKKYLEKNGYNVC